MANRSAESLERRRAYSREYGRRNGDTIKVRRVDKREEYDERARRWALQNPERAKAHNDARRKRHLDIWFAEVAAWPQ